MSEVKEVEKKYLMDLNMGRYELVALAEEWLAVFQKTDDAKGMSPSEMVKKALEDVSSGAVTSEDIKRVRTKAKAAPAAEEPKEEKIVEEEEEKKPKKNAKSKK